MIVTIDGPAGTGKSTVARRLAEELGFQFLDTGAMYRMVALQSIRQQLTLTSDEEIRCLTESSQFDLSGGRYLLDGVDVSQEIRTTEVARAASFVAQIPSVRTLLVQRQREFAAERNVVCEGRDQGTVAFPYAECKFYLTAAPAERARRRVTELQASGKDVDFDELLKEQTARDQRDAGREASPLRPANDAILVDTTSLELEDVVNTLRELILNHPAFQHSQL
ncbi:MAG TPA: (d)CMP kinase [Planctomicrobium sp.]|nr:(d)CMP kinase [Planctomicrobium sp.]